MWKTRGSFCEPWGRISLVENAWGFDGLLVEGEGHGAMRRRLAVKIFRRIEESFVSLCKVRILDRFWSAY